MADHTAPYTYHLPLSDDGEWVLTDFEVKIGFRVVSDGGEIEITSVCMDGWHLLTASGLRPIDLLAAADPLVRGLGEKIRDAAHADGGWIADALSENGWEYRGKGGVDPDGRFERVA